MNFLEINLILKVKLILDKVRNQALKKLIPYNKRNIVNLI